MRRSTVLLISWMLLFTVLAMIFLAFIGAAALTDQGVFQFYADSITYHAIYSGDVDIAGGSLIGVASNYVGPMLVLKIAGGNVYNVLLLNVLIFSVSMVGVARTLRLDILRVTILLMLSPLTISSLLSVNKEIFIFPFLALALGAHYKRSAMHAVLALGVAILFRWQLMLFYVVLLAMDTLPRSSKRRGWLVLFLLIGISAIYSASQELLEPVLSVAETSIADYEGGSGLFEMTLNYQKTGWYFLVFPIRAFHLLFGMGLRIDSILSPQDIYNDLFVSIHCLVSIFLFAMLLMRRRISLNNDLVFSGVVFLIIFCITPIFAPRYLYPIYVLMVLVLVGVPRSPNRRVDLSNINDDRPQLNCAQVAGNDR